MTAIYNGANSKNDVVFLRSYDSRRETAPEYDCTIWEAGRATCSIGLAFKPIRIGQTVFHDGGDGRFNPSPEALEEAMANEWPGREVGVFLSLGTGKRPKGSETNRHEWYEGFMGGFAEAKRRLIAKIEGCEKTHEHMKKDVLSKYGVNVDNYYRLNVEVGVGEFGMNEWHRLSEISTSTRMYLGRKVEQKMVQDTATKLAKINRAKQRFERLSEEPELEQDKYNLLSPLAIELPAEIPDAWPPAPNTPSSRKSVDRQSYDSGVDSLTVPHNQRSPRSSFERVLPPIPQHEEAPLPPPLAPRQKTPPTGRARPPSAPAGPKSSPDDHEDRLMVHAPSPAQYRQAAGTDKIAIISADERPKSSGYGGYSTPPPRVEPPPLPPKTPLPEHQQQAGPGGMRRVGTAPVVSTVAPPPYPLDDEQPPPPVGRKPPNYHGR